MDKMSKLMMLAMAIPDGYFGDYLDALFLAKEKHADRFPHLPTWDEMDKAICNSTDPGYYSRWEIEPLEFITRNKLDFLRGNIIKYIMRYDMKGGIEDLRKARVYLDKLIESAEKD